MHKARTEALIGRLAQMGLKGALVHKPANIRYLSGYTGEGMLLITEGIRAIITDFRYTEQAEHQAPDYTVHMTETGLSQNQVAKNLLAGTGITALGYEDDEITVKAMATLQKALEGFAFTPMDRAIEALRIIKDETEIALIEKACAIACKAFDHMLGFLRPGLTEKEVRLELENALYRCGADGIAFDTIIASGPNGSLPHAIPSDRALQKGEMVTLDFGARYGGYCSDMTRTVAIGTIDAQKRKVYDTVLAAQLAALEAIRPGAICQEVDKIARDIIHSAGYEGRFGHGLGHALGLDIHEDPRLSQRDQTVLKAGIVVTNEPGIYLPGDCGCRIEDTVLVTESGYRRLTEASKELYTL